MEVIIWFLILGVVFGKVARYIGSIFHFSETIAKIIKKITR